MGFEDKLVLRLTPSAGGGFIVGGGDLTPNLILEDGSGNIILEDGSGAIDLE